MIILYIAIFLFIGYAILIIYYWLSWRSVPEFIPEKKIYSTTISVIIPARNEEKNIVFIAAPVVLQNNSSVLQIFQAMDFLVLQGITAASVYKQFHSMCNGANLAYEKKAFEEVNGFESIDHIASGDDMLLMHKIRKKFPGRLNYLKSKKVIVSTQPMKTWKEFLNQRTRWASKARFYDDKRIFFVLLLVYLFNFS